MHACSSFVADDQAQSDAPTAAAVEERQRHDHSYAQATDTVIATSSAVICDFQSFISQQAQMKTCVVRKPVWLSRSTTASFTATDKKVRLNTGLPNKATFEKLFSLLSVRAQRMRYWLGPKRSFVSNKRAFRRTPTKSGPKRKLSCKDEFVLTLMKLRLGLTNEFLATLYAITVGSCSSIIHTWIKFLSRELKCLIVWPSKEQIRCYLPKSLRQKYPNLRCTIDCSETFIDRPRDLKLQASTWSDYKHHNTLKYLVAITPDGMISFISKAWGGRTTDRYIVQNSGFLDVIEPYDLVLADRGFTIREDLLFKRATLEIPPATTGLKQMSRQNVFRTKKIANARIHVERAINRIKWFKILSSTLSLSLIPLFDDILRICACLCNMLPPLVA